jgi:ABC-2 type transport system ATP-binding protein
MRDAIISARDLSKQFGDQYAVRNATFDVPRGSIFGFIGPSGSGKTTTIRLLTGLLRPTSGEVTVLGRPPATFTQATRERIGYLPQLFVLYPQLSVWENLQFTASIYGVKLRRAARLNELLDFVELSAHRHKQAQKISGGMQRRLSLAATLVHDPELIFLDEPTAGVDPVLRRKFWDYFNQLKTEGRTLFVTTQYVSEAAYCDLVAVMRDGALMLVDTPEMLRKRAYGGDVVDLRTENQLDDHRLQLLWNEPYVHGRIRRLDDTLVRIIVDEASTAVPAILGWAQERGVQIASIEEYLPPFDDVFVELMRLEQTHV